MANCYCIDHWGYMENNQLISVLVLNYKTFANLFVEMNELQLFTE